MAKFDSFKIGDEEVKPVSLRSGGAEPEVTRHNGNRGMDYMLQLQDTKWDIVLGSQMSAESPHQINALWQNYSD